MEARPIRVDINSPAYARFMLALGFTSLLSVLGTLALGIFSLATWHFYIEILPAIGLAASSTLAVIYLHGRALQENPHLFDKKEKETENHESKKPIEYV